MGWISFTIIPGRDLNPISLFIVAFLIYPSFKTKHSEGKVVKERERIKNERKKRKEKREKAKKKGRRKE